MTVATVGAGAAGPGAALQVARALAVFDFVGCNFTHQERLSFPVSLIPGFQVGHPVGAHYRGAVIANVCITLLCTCLLFAIFFAVRALVVGTSREPVETSKLKFLRVSNPNKEGGLKASKLLRFPGCVGFVVAFIVDGTISCSVSLIVGRGATPAVDLVLGLVGMLSIVVLCVLFVMLVAKPAHQHCEFVVDIFEGKEDPPIWVRWLKGKGEWRPRQSPDEEDPAGEATLARYSALFIRYRGDSERNWFRIASNFYLVDIILTGIVSFLKGIKPTTLSTCNGLLWAVCFINGIGVIFAVVLRPYTAPMKNMLLILASLMMLLATVSVGGAQLRQDRRGVHAGETLALAATYVVMISVGLSILRMFLDLSEKFNTKQTNEKKKKMKDGADRDRFEKNVRSAVNQNDVEMMMQPQAVDEPLLLDSGQDDDDLVRLLGPPVAAADVGTAVHDEEDDDELLFGSNQQEGNAARKEVQEEGEWRLRTTSIKNGKVIRPEEGQRRFEHLPCDLVKFGVTFESGRSENVSFSISCCYKNMVGVLHKRNKHYRG